MGFTPILGATNFWKEPKPTPSKYVQMREGAQMLSIDLDGNGLPDLLNANSGELLSKTTSWPAAATRAAKCSESTRFFEQPRVTMFIVLPIIQKR